MPKIKYEEKDFSPAKIIRIDQANSIITVYRQQGYDLTLRQLYYQFVARDLIPNKQSEYKKLGTLISDARRAGLIDWEAIVDRTRFLRSLPHWSSPSSYIMPRGFHVDMWDNQHNRIEVWIEKDALAGVFERVCQSLDVPFFSCRGYPSDSETWKAGQRLKMYADRGQTPIILHFGDHDPSGKDMTRDIREKLALFGELDIEVQRLALNMDQIEQYDPPPNPAKESDPRAKAYIAEYGEESWELDALEPSVLARLVEDAVLSYRDEDLWEEKEAEKQEGIERLKKVVEELRKEEDA